MPDIRPLILSHSDRTGGASRAAYRLHAAFQEVHVNSQMMVRLKKTNDSTVIGDDNLWTKAIAAMRWRAGYSINHLQRTKNYHLHSANWLPSNWSSRINSAPFDVANLHWVCGETMSIEDIGRISKPIVMTLHDMWAFCGTEHHVLNDSTPRWRDGYKSGNRQAGEGGVDLDRLTWKRKVRSWSGKGIVTVSPSKWLRDLAAQSSIFSKSTNFTIPNPLDLNRFKPHHKKFSREVLGFPIDEPLILFGAFGGTADPGKGAHHLVEALRIISARHSDERWTCVIFGGGSLDPTIRLRSFSTGHVSDDITLSLLYSAADVMVVPSERENLPQTATEAQACGCPVVGFNCSGMPDAVEHGGTGYLAEPYSAHDLAHGIEWVIESTQKDTSLNVAARRRAEQLWAPKLIADQYMTLFQTLIQQPRSYG